MFANRRRRVTLTLPTMTELRARARDWLDGFEVPRAARKATEGVLDRIGRGVADGLASARSRLDRARDDLPFGRRRRTMPVRLAAIVAASTAAVAYLAAYLLDPVRGAARRSRLLDRGRSAARTAFHAVDMTARDAANRARGGVATIRSMRHEEPPVDQVLEARVRTALGRAARHAGAIHVAADGGQVVLSGPVLRDETPRILATAWGVRGVLGIEDRLDVRESAGDIPALQGEGPQPEPRPDFLQRNWAPTTRLLAVVGGAAAIVLGIARGGALGMLALAGGALVTLRGATNLGIGRSLGLAGSRRAIDVQKTIEIDAPVEQVYDLWSRFETFPEFMSHVREVRRSDDDRSHWVVAGPGGIPVEFDAVVTERVPNEVIAWKSVEGEPIRHAGIVRFEPAGDHRSRVDVRMSYNPPAGVIGHAVNELLGTDPKQALDADLLRFQSLLGHGKTTADGSQTTLDEVGRRVH